MDIFSAQMTLQGVIVLVLQLAALAGCVLALVHAAVQRPDVFPAVDRQSKVIWVCILAVATVVVFAFGPVRILGIIAVVAMLVYLVDVRPRVDAIQGKSWFSKRA